MTQKAKKREGFKTYKKQKTAEVTEKQRKSIKTTSRKLYTLIGQKKTYLVQEDEINVKTDFSAAPCPRYYTNS